MKDFEWNLFWNVDYESYTVDNKRNILIENNIEGKKILSVLYNDEKILLNSRYNTKEFANIWCRQQDLSNPYTIAVILGISDGTYIEELRKLYENLLIIAYEPSYEIAKYVKKSHSFDKYESDDKTIILVGEKGYSTLIKILEQMITFANEKYVKFMVSPNYERIFKKEEDSIVELIKELRMRLLLNRNTKFIMGRSSLVNCTKNIIDSVEQYIIADLYRALAQVDKEKTPAIVVAAGPSLDKNINELRKAKGKAFIIAVDTALNSLAKADIIPDVFVTIDPEKPVELFANKKMINVPMITSILSNHEISRVHKGKRIYQQPCESVLNKYMIKFEKNCIYLETGGSVANNAYSLAQQAGFKTVIFIGQDLAYPNNQVHSKDSFGENHNNYVEYNNYNFFYVDDNYGNSILTEYNMNIYRLWFEKQIIRHSDVKFVNATEGGAKINGAEFITLKEAINKYCNNENKIDFGELINGIEPVFTQDQKKEIFEYLANYDKEILSIKKKMREGISFYEKLETYNNKQDYFSKGFQTTYNKISELNEWLTNSPETAYLSSYTFENDYNVFDEIYEEKESTYEDIKHVIKNGMKTIDALMKASDKSLEDLKDVIYEANERLKENK